MYSISSPCGGGEGPGGQVFGAVAPALAPHQPPGWGPRRGRPPPACGLGRSGFPPRGSGCPRNGAWTRCFGLDRAELGGLGGSGHRAEQWGGALCLLSPILAAWQQQAELSLPSLVPWGCSDLPGGSPRAQELWVHMQGLWAESSQRGLCSTRPHVVFGLFPTTRHRPDPPVKTLQRLRVPHRSPLPLQLPFPHQKATNPAPKLQICPSTAALPAWPCPCGGVGVARAAGPGPGAGGAVIDEPLPTPGAAALLVRAFGGISAFLAALLFSSLGWSLPALLERAARSRGGGKAAFNEQRGCGAVLGTALLERYCPFYPQTTPFALPEPLFPWPDPCLGGGRARCIVRAGVDKLGLPREQPIWIRSWKTALRITMRLS